MSKKFRAQCPGGARGKAFKRAGLIRRDGLACRYCRCQLPDASHASIDHVVPHSLFRTWDQRHLVVSCRPCNAAKGDRLPLVLALLLADRARPVDTPTLWTVPLLRLLAVHLTPPPTR